MKKRILSIVCIVALLATVISVCAVYAFGADEEALVGTGFEFDSSVAAVADDWTFTHEQSKVNTSGGITLQDAGGSKAETPKATYNETFDLTNGFTITYSANGGYTNNYEANKLYFGVDVDTLSARLQLADGKGSYNLILKVGDNVVATSDPVEITGVSTYFGTAKEFTLDYDIATKTYTYKILDNGTETTVSYVDEEDTINLTDATVLFRSNSTWDNYAVYSAAKLVGKEPPAPPPALYGTGLVVSSTNPADPEKWTLSNAQCTVGNGITVHANSANSLNKATYNEPFILTDGFELTFNGCTAGTSNIQGQANKNFLGAKVGNITAALRVVDTKDAIVMVIAVDDTVVATSDHIYDSTDPVWTRDTPARNIEYFFSTYYMGNSEFVLSYDPATKTVTYSLTVGSTEEGTLTYVDDADAIDLSEAVLEFQSQGAWNAHAYYKSIKLEGATCTEHVFDDANDTDCNNCGAIREIGGGEPGDNIVRGEALTTWAPEGFVAEDWTGHTDKFVDGEFVIETGNPTYTVWTAKNYDMSEGFTFKGTLKMKNGYNNFYNEWCSAYFGTEEENLELRIRNDDTTPSDSNKDNTYTAYLLYKGEEIASSDLTVLPNGEYELTYKDGKVSVNLGGVAISWTPADGSAATTSVAVDAKETLYNAKLGLRLSGNYCPNGREWSVISIEKISKGGVHTGDSRNLVLPACVMLLSAVAVAVVLGKKKVMG